MPATLLFSRPLLHPSNGLHSLSIPAPSPSNRPITRLPNYPSFSSSIASSHSQPNTIISNSPISENPTNISGAAIKMPTAPWMNSPLLLPPDQIVDLSKRGKKTHSDRSKGPDRSLTQWVRRGRGRQAMKKILEGISRLQKIDGVDERENSVPGESEFRVSLVGGGEEDDEGPVSGRGRMPWAQAADKFVFRREKKVRVPTAAESSIPAAELERLRSEGSKIGKWVKVKKAGVTERAVDEIRMAWKECELAMVKFGLPLCRNMDRAREIVETKTGGLVVWSKKDTLVVYRGSNYQSPAKVSPNLHSGLTDGEQMITRDSVSQHRTMAAKEIEENSLPASLVVVKNEGIESCHSTLYEREGNRLLNGLGPRFIDWWRPKPLPVDADLLPEVVPGYKPPFRLCPPRMRSKLTDDELTYLRRLARPLPTHFVLGRNRKLQGLASAILKLWEKSLIVKIAVKYGIPNTNNAQMSWELKRLTGGVLILRNKFYIILYRGKDFLPGRVASLIAEREKELKTQLWEEEVARSKTVESFNAFDERLPIACASGTFSEFQDIQIKNRHLLDGNREIKVQIEAEKERLEKELQKQKHKLLILQLKTERSEKELAKLDFGWKPADPTLDQEMLTEEERQMFGKIGLKMNATLLLGRRGVFNSVIGSIHQHWKHREVVKVITMQKAYSQVISTAALLEIESGGILVAVEKLRTGHAIIIYRGKNYKRPLKLLPENLLTKREALRRSIEMQRRGCLKYFAYQRQRAIWDLEHKLREIEKEGSKYCHSNVITSKPKSH